jgi:hypothetical protein
MTEQRTELPDLPEEALKRMKMTPERWAEVRAEFRERQERAPKVGQAAPDFDLPFLGDSERTVRLSSFQGRRPVALVFGSYT